MFLDPPSLINVLLRFGHIMFGIIWLGHLFFFNLVNVPFQADLDKELKPKVNPKLLLRAFWWFRWGAMWTFIFGLALFGYKYMHQHMLFEQGGGISPRGGWIMIGMLIAIIMWFNVWFVIWPRQKLILGGMAAGTPHPDAAKLAATAGKASRFNTYASGPMLFAMIVPNNYSGWSYTGLILTVILGLGFWIGMIKRSFKVKTTV
ncbi:MAG TPA: urate hydroxylase PuuD [Polyangia bacterium]|nr:urate hydroxylase PuuD [Polyangia bacterium]